jgi:hypothetical protein
MVFSLMQELPLQQEKKEGEIMSLVHEEGCLTAEQYWSRRSEDYENKYNRLVDKYADLSIRYSNLAEKHADYLIKQEKKEG